MFYVRRMRTTLTIDDDMMSHAKAIANQENRSIGAVVSELMRDGFESRRTIVSTRNGFPILPRRGATVTLAMVNAARDAED